MILSHAHATPCLVGTKNLISDINFHILALIYSSLIGGGGGGGEVVRMDIDNDKIMNGISSQPL